MIIYIKTLTGKTITIEAELNDTIFSIKEKIEKEEKIKANQQRLLFKNTELNELETLGTYDLYDEATVYLVVRMPNVSIEKSDIKESVNVSNADRVSFNITTSDKSEITLEMAGNSKIANVKEEINKVKGTQDNYEIILHFQGKLLINDRKTLNDYDIPHDSTLHMTVRVHGGN